MLRKARAVVFDLHGVLVDTSRRGADPLPGAVALLESLSAAAVPVAIVSSGGDALEALPDQLRGQVELVWGGEDDTGLLLEGARQLAVPPAATAVVAGATAGVRAGIAEGFAVVVGVDQERSGHLDDAGADLIVPALHELPGDISTWAELIPDPPSALERIDEIIGRLGSASGIFLDYDGTLTPIVDDPAAATISDRERAILGELAELAPVAVISGRGLDDVKRHVGVKGIIYSGSHGFEIERPDGTRFEQPDAATVLPELDDAELALLDQAEDLPGVMIERKPYAVAVHTRRARGEEERLKARELVESLVAKHPDLVVRGGKEVLELCPDIDWGKGSALAYLLETLAPDALPMYIGDDETDEDAFAEVRRRFGAGILVGRARGGETWAGYTVPGTEDVLRLLPLLTDRFRR